MPLDERWCESVQRPAWMPPPPEWVLKTPKGPGRGPTLVSYAQGQPYEGTLELLRATAAKAGFRRWLLWRRAELLADPIAHEHERAFSRLDSITRPPPKRWYLCGDGKPQRPWEPPCVKAMQFVRRPFCGAFKAVMLLRAFVAGSEGDMVMWADASKYHRRGLMVNGSAATAAASLRGLAGGSVRGYLHADIRRPEAVISNRVMGARRHPPNQLHAPSPLRRQHKPQRPRELLNVRSCGRGGERLHLRRVLRALRRQQGAFLLEATHPGHLPRVSKHALQPRARLGLALDGGRTARGLLLEPHPRSSRVDDACAQPLPSAPALLAGRRQERLLPEQRHQLCARRAPRRPLRSRAAVRVRLDAPVKAVRRARRRVRTVVRL